MSVLGRATRPVTVVGVLVGAGLVLLSAGRDWVTVSVPGAGPAAHVSATGNTAATGTVAVALVALAGAVVLATGGRAVRRIVAIVLFVAGLGVIALSVPVWRSPRDAAGAAIARATGTVGGSAGVAATTSWPAVSAAGGLLICVAAGLVLARGAHWAGPSRRFDRPPAPSSASSVPGAAPADDWDRLSRGEDPTDERGAGHGPVLG